MSTDSAAYDARFAAITAELDLGETSEHSAYQPCLYSRHVTAGSDTFVLDGPFADHIGGDNARFHVLLLEQIISAYSAGYYSGLDIRPLIPTLIKGLPLFGRHTLSRDDFVALAQVARTVRMIFHTTNIARHRAAFIAAGVQTGPEPAELSADVRETLFESFFFVLGMIVDDSAPHLDLY